MSMAGALKTSHDDLGDVPQQTNEMYGLWFSVVGVGAADGGKLQNRKVA